MRYQVQKTTIIVKTSTVSPSENAITNISFLRHNRLYLSFIICIYHNNLSSFKCKTCNMNFEDKQHLENHKKVHGRKAKVYEYGDPEFTKDRLRG